MARSAGSVFAASRALGIEAPAALAMALDSIPAAAIDNRRGNREHRLRAWQLFFQGSLLKAGRLSSTTPLAIHYNPVLDVALIQGCGTGANPPRASGCRQQFCALPGEALSGTRVKGLGPEWLSEPQPLEALVAVSRSRISGFEAAHPADARGPTEWRDAYCNPKWQEMAELRVIQGLVAVPAIQPGALGGAVARYVGERRTAGPRTDSGARRLDFLLANLSAFSLSGAVELPGDRHLLILTPRVNGWYALALLMGAPAGVRGGSGTLLDATVLSFAREVER